ncbi:hypothetical protein C7R94_02265 [Brevibacillus sp. NRRL NRS-603]|nr:hypothetical protein C7R94_02265 [Brevibacillus sp. NRRL NRS-603]
MGDWKSIKINGIAKIEKLVADESYLRFLVFFQIYFIFKKIKRLLTVRKLQAIITSIYHTFANMV